MIPGRVVSLVPSWTQSVFDLGAGDHLVGVTRFCLHPAERLAELPRVGGTKNPDIHAIRDLDPDLVIMDREENRAEDAAALESFTRIHVSRVDSIERCLIEIERLAGVLGCPCKSTLSASRIRACLTALDAERAPQTGKPRVAYLIWKNPWMAVSGQTFIGDMLRTAGLTNVFEEDAAPYPAFEFDALVEHKPDLVLLSSEPYSFNDNHLAECRGAGLATRIVDGEAVGWFGTRIDRGLEHLAAIRREWAAA